MTASVSANSRLPGALRAPATILPVAGSRTSPKAFTATRLDTSTPPGQGHGERADARFHGLLHAEDLCRPSRPCPRPPQPSATGVRRWPRPPRLRPLRGWGGRSPCRCRGRREWPPATIGIRRRRRDEAHAALLQVAAHARSGFQAEGAAAGQQDAVHLRGDVAEDRAWRISSVPLADPRMSTPPTAPCSHRMAVQPVIASKSETCPTRIPGMSVSPFIMRLMVLW